MNDTTPRNHDEDHDETSDGKSSGSAKDWQVELIGRTDTLIYVEVRDGRGDVWSGSLPKIEPADTG